MTDLHLHSLFHPLDPLRVLSQDLYSDAPVCSYGNRLCLIPEDDEYAGFESESEAVDAVSFVFIRGPRYGAYAVLRESRLLKRHRERRFAEEIKRIDPAVTGIPPKKQLKFQNLPATRNLGSGKDVKVSNFVGSGRVGGKKGSSSVVAQSVPDFSAVLRKENRRPAVEITLTPPSVKKGSPGMGSGWSAKGSRSAGVAEKRAGGISARKSYASLEELRGSTVRAANAICGGPGDGKRRILGSRRL